MNQLQKDIEAEAYRLGFSLFGVTSSEPPVHFDIFKNWLERGFHGEMAYLSRSDTLKKRMDPKQILEDCCSIIVLGMNYPSSEENKTDLAISSYAKGADYHRIISERMKQLISFIEKKANRNISAVLCADSTPILERELAQRAGLGWIGRNSCLISPSQGSFFFLAESLINIPLPISEPFKHDYCGKCHQCIEACPTGCIQPDRTIDARGCISYLTIEKRGMIPTPLRKKMGNWIFGCDLCQKVCPWNKKADQRIVDEVFKSTNENLNLDPSLILRMSQEEFNHRFRTSPILRTKWEGLIRNVLIASGNYPDGMIRSEIIKLLQSQRNPVIRGTAIWALARFPDRTNLDLIKSIQKAERDTGVLEEISAYLKN